MPNLRKPKSDLDQWQHFKKAFSGESTRDPISVSWPLVTLFLVTLALAAWGLG
jgi:hypothetical protein